jgi:fluoride exporter
VTDRTLEQRRPFSDAALRLTAPLAVLTGGLIGSGTRAAIGELFPVGVGRFPMTTLLVNLAGSLLLGLYLARRQRAATARWSVQFWAIGVLGSFTTFSAFGAEVFRLVEADAAVVAVGYVVASTVGGLAAALLGQRWGRVSR